MYDIVYTSCAQGKYDGEPQPLDHGSVWGKACVAGFCDQNGK